MSFYADFTEISPLKIMNFCRLVALGYLVLEASITWALYMKDRVHPSPFAGFKLYFADSNKVTAWLTGSSYLLLG